MSSILKALQKVEAEKAARRNAAPIAGEIGRIRQRRGVKSRWLIPAAMVAVAAVAVFATYTFMGGLSRQNQAVVAPAAVKAAAAPVQNPQLQPMLPEPAAPIRPGPTAPLFRHRQPVAVKVPAAPAAKVIPPPTTAIEVMPTEPQPINQAPVAKREPDLPVQHQTRAGADLKVSGIAWQKESVSRLAVVNGTPVVQGAVVEGARVEEIFQDRVRFSRDNSSFEVPLGKVSTER